MFAFPPFLMVIITSPPSSPASLPFPFQFRSPAWFVEFIDDFSIRRGKRNCEFDWTVRFYRSAGLSFGRNLFLKEAPLPAVLSVTC